MRWLTTRSRQSSRRHVPARSGMAVSLSCLSNRDTTFAPVNATSSDMDARRTFPSSQSSQRMGIYSKSRRQRSIEVDLELRLQFFRKFRALACDVEHVDGAMSFRRDEGHFNVAAVNGD